MPELAQWPTTVRELVDLATEFDMAPSDLLVELERQLGPMPRPPMGYELAHKSDERWVGPELVSGRWIITQAWHLSTASNTVEVWMADHKPPTYANLTALEALRLATDLAAVARAVMIAADENRGKDELLNDSHPDLSPQPIGRFEWERVVRRAIIKPPSVKMLGFVMATYANADGSRVRPGQRRLAAVMGTSVSTVERGQRALEDLGLIQMTYKGHSAGRGRTGGYASEFQLTIPSDLLERIPMLDPDESHPAPVTGDSTKQPAPVTGVSLATPSRESRESEEIPVISKETPVTGAETPVNLQEIPVTHDGPPDHYHHIKDHNTNQSSARFETSVTNARAREIDGSGDVSFEDERAKQMRALQQLIGQQKEAS